MLAKLKVKTGLIFKFTAKHSCKKKINTAVTKRRNTAIFMHRNIHVHTICRFFPYRVHNDKEMNIWDCMLK